MFSMARVRRGGSGGVKEGTLRLRQPRGTVTTTSSKMRESVSVLTRSLALESEGELFVIERTLVDRRILALARAALATRSRIALYVLATNRFSRYCQKYPENRSALPCSGNSLI